MVRVDRISSGFLGSVGFRQPFNPDFAIVDATNLTSNSQLYYQDGSSFVTIENIKDCQNYPSISNADFNTYLTRMQNQSALKVCQKVIAGQSSFIQDANLYPYEKSFSNTIEPNSKFVGFKVEPYTFNSTKISKVKWIELSFDSAATFYLYLFNSNDPGNYVKRVEVTTAANKSVVVNVNDWFFADDDNHKGGYYYLGYFEDDLAGAKALKKDYELSDNQVVSKYYYIVPVTVDHSGGVLDVTSHDEKSDTYGLNIGISVYTDYTERIISNKSLFYQALQYQMAEEVLNLIRTSIRSNITQRLSKENINSVLLELYGNREAGIEGIDGKLKREIDSIKKALFYKPLIIKSTMKY